MNDNEEEVKTSRSLVTAGLLAGTMCAAHAADIGKYDVVWDSPGKDATGSMPLGNGELGINLWVEENGDLLFYLGRNDSFSEVSILCYHRNENAAAFESSIRVQSLESIRDRLKDPLLHRTFGGWMTGNHFESTDDQTLATPQPVQEFHLRVAGLNEVPARLCALPEALTTPEQRTFFAHMKACAPEIPMREATLEGNTVRYIAPAQKYIARTSNVENPGLYVIWPFRLFGLNRPMLEEARNTYRLKEGHLDVGWGYDGNVAARLGLTDEAAGIMRTRIANSNSRYRWPATWGPNFDWVPDQCHGGNLMASMNEMLLQEVNGKILLLPAWPRDWDVSFKLHAPGKAVVECELRAGKIVKLEVTPKSRKKDVVIVDPLATPTNDDFGIAPADPHSHAGE